LFFGQPLDVKKTRRIPIPLEICSLFGSERPNPIFISRCDTLTSATALSIVIRNDPVEKAAKFEPLETGYRLEERQSTENVNCLLITGIVLHFIPDFSDPRNGTAQAGQYETFAFKMKETQCYLRIFSMDRYIPGEWSGDRWILDDEEQKEWTCILLARDHLQGFILHHLMFINLDDDTGIAERCTVFELLVPLNDLDILEEFKPCRRRIVLA
jgi:hypothetical protein